MSANPNRADWDAPDSRTPLQEGNRVLESIARQEALRALLAFSELHEQIRNRRAAQGRSADEDLFETERFILDEVLQLICNRAQAITQADGIIVALAKPADPSQKQSGSPLPVMVCRAAAGPLAVETGVPLIAESRFLQECVESGRILRCDDCDNDPRVERDFAYQMGVRSTVLVPLRGRLEQVGVLQAFSTTVRAFTDEDVRCFDLFSELVLAALKPEDQDRRINWLAEVAGEVLKPRATSIAAAPAETAMEPQYEAAEIPIESAIEPPVEPVTEPFVEMQHAATSATATGPAITCEHVVAESPTASAKAAEATPSVDLLAQPVVITAEQVELPELASDKPGFNEPKNDEIARDKFGSYELSVADEPFEHQAFELNGETPEPLPFLVPPLPATSRPRLSVVLGLIAVAALFSAGAWWGMQVHGKTMAAKAEVAHAVSEPPSVTAPAPPPDVASVPVADNLMSPVKADAEPTPLMAVAADKLAALPKITGVRHWSSSMGSTVVIDMQDQVPYEVHRLMSPERIYFDLHDTALASDLDGKTMDVGDTSLTRVRVAQPVAGVTRVVLDTKDGSNFSVSMESSPYRLVVELRGSTNIAANTTRVIASRTSTAAAAVTPKAAPVEALAVKVPDQALPARTGKFRIVLDAGHGGWDLGTVGRLGLLEKDLVLDVTQRLGKLLQARLGSEVMFTRTSDSYLPLDQRADFANQSQADLFVSVHANYSSSAAARGVETYYTNLFSAPGSREAEKHEIEKHDDGTFAKLTPVSLSAGGLRDKIEESRRLAASVQHSLYATLASNSPDIRNRGIKDASFLVLTGTTMPSILTEISFVSSPADERNLQSAAYRQQIAEALYKGIARYQETAPRSKIAQLQTASARR